MPHPPSIRPSPYRPPTRGQIERARTMYAEGFTVSRILAACDMALGTLYYWLDGGPREEERPLYPALPRRREVVGKRRAPLSANRASLTDRLWRTTERQARDIEERLSRPGAPSPERERDVRMLATLVRTLRELAAFDCAPPGEGADAAPEIARDRMERDRLMREAEGRAGVARDMVSYLKEIRKAETSLKQREEALAGAHQDKASSAAATDELRADVARRIKGVVAARQAERERHDDQAGG